MEVPVSDPIYPNNVNPNPLKKKRGPAPRFSEEEKREKRLAKKRAYRERNREKIRARDKAYNKHNRSKRNTYVRNRRITDPVFNLIYRIRNRTRKAFLRLSLSKPAKTEELLGTDWPTAKAHLESLFKPGMTWENMGEWHIDHIIPLATAKTEEELYTLCYYTNLQPLWAEENISKGSLHLGSRIKRGLREDP